MAIKDIDDLTRPLSDLVGEQGEKAARRKNRKKDKACIRQPFITNEVT